MRYNKSIIMNIKKIVLGSSIIIGILLLVTLGYFALTRNNAHVSTSPIAKIHGTVQVDVASSPDVLDHYEIVEVVAGRDVGSFLVDAYDSAGHHTGPGSNYPFIEKKIPNSDLTLFGNKVYLTLDINSEYKVQLNGIANDTLTLKIKSNSMSFSYPETKISSTFRATITLRRGGGQMPPDLEVDTW